MTRFFLSNSSFSVKTDTIFGRIEGINLRGKLLIQKINRKFVYWTHLDNNKLSLVES